MTPQHLPNWSELHPSRGFAADFLRLYGTDLRNSDSSLEVRLILRPEVVAVTTPFGHSTEEIQVTAYGIGDELPERTVLADPDDNHYNLGRGRRLANGWRSYALACQENF